MCGDASSAGCGPNARLSRAHRHRRDDRSAQLAQNAVVIVNQADEKAAATEAENIAQAYQGIARDWTTALTSLRVAG